MLQQLGPLVAQFDVSASGCGHVAFVGWVSPAFEEGGDPHHRVDVNRPYWGVYSVLADQLMEADPSVDQ